MSNARALEIARNILRKVDGDSLAQAVDPEGRRAAYKVPAGMIDDLRDQLEQADSLDGRLRLLREEVEEYRATYHEPGDDPHDTLHEIADGMVPIYHSDAIDVLTSDPWRVLEAADEAAAEYGQREDSDPLQLVRWGLYWLFSQEAAEHWRKLEEQEQQGAAV